MRRISPVAWLLLALVAATVMAGRFSTPVSLAPGAVAALLALGVVLEERERGRRGLR
jgi:hypothetical protein